MEITITNVVVVIMSFIFAIFGYNGNINYEPANPTPDTYSNMYESPYYMDASGDYVANIPYDKYLLPESPNVGTVYSIAAYGASVTNDGKENAIAINAAVTAANENGGGTVYVSGGAFKTSTIVMKSNVTLKIADGSSLVSVNYEENKALVKPYTLSGGVIKIYNVDNVTIEGPGKIIGNGRTFMNDPKKTNGLKVSDVDVFNLYEYNLAWRDYIAYHKDNPGRVNLIRTLNCNNLVIHNIVLQETAAWTMRIETCKDVLVTNVIMNNNVHVENADGVNFVGCENVVMHDSFVTAADDGICLKSYEDSGCYNHEIYNCEVMSLASCFKVGTPTVMPVENIEVYNCKFFRAGIMGGYAGISLESADGTDMNNVYIHDIDMDGILSPLLIWLGSRLEHGGIEEVGSMSDITVKNITARNVDLPSAIRGCTVDGQKRYVSNVTLENFTVTYRDVDEKLSLPGILEPFFLGASENVYPEITRVLYLGLGDYESSIMKDYPVYGLYVKYADGLTVKNFNVLPRTCNTRPFTNI